MIQVKMPRIDAGPFRLGAAKATTRKLWRPNPGPQTLAYNSPADVLGYGGAGGGGKTDLLLGLASTRHKQSVVFRRVFPNLRAIIERSREILNPSAVVAAADRYNESLHRWVLTDGRMIEFEACQFEKDKEKQRGRPRDFYGFDEATEFSRSQVEFIIAWLRSTAPGQRCRVVLTFNPPTSDAGGWVTDYFLPWLAYLHPDTFTHANPAAPGELRWYATIDGKETECPDGKPFLHNGETIRPLSRSFIPAKLEDNPHLNDTNYRSVLQSLPEPLRSQMLYGDFAAAAEDDPWQVFPTAWVRLAQDRWGQRERPTTPLTALGVDCARGGSDKTTIARRFDNWFDEVLTYPGKETATGPIVAEKVRQAVGHAEPLYINVDVIGVGSSVYDALTPMYGQTQPVNVAEASDYRDKSGKLKARNVRAEMYWRLREALDPVTGDDLALPPGAELLADLCAARYTVTSAGILIEPKDAIKERIGRSPDVGEAVLLAHLNRYTAPAGDVVDVDEDIYKPKRKSIWD